jgi:lysozyme
MFKTMNLELIKQNEGYRSKPYTCTAGNLTVGYGCNLDAGIDKELANIIFQYQISKVEDFLVCFAFWYNINSARQTVLADMCFQMGRAGFNRFKKMVAALHNGDFEKAADEILDSKYARDDTPARANRNAEIMRSGSF